MARPQSSMIMSRRSQHHKQTRSHSLANTPPPRLSTPSFPSTAAAAITQQKQLQQQQRECHTPPLIVRSIAAPRSARLHSVSMFSPSVKSPSRPYKSALSSPASSPQSSAVRLLSYISIVKNSSGSPPQHQHNHHHHQPEATPLESLHLEVTPFSRSLSSRQQRGGVDGGGGGWGVATTTAATGTESSCSSAARISAADPRMLGVFELKAASLVMDHGSNNHAASASTVTASTTTTTTTTTTAATTPVHKLRRYYNDDKTLKAEENEDICQALSGNNRGNRLFSRSDNTVAVTSSYNVDEEAVESLVEETSPPQNAYDNRLKKAASCRRNLSKELEKELTFKPELNQRSLKIFSRSTRQYVPLMSRLTEKRKKAVMRERDSAYTFAPHINPNSVKLAHERAGKIEEVSYFDTYL